MRCCIDHLYYHYLVAYEVSNNQRSRWSNADVDFLGYRPQDDSERFAQNILAKRLVEDLIAARFHGGSFCPLEFEGDVECID